MKLKVFFSCLILVLLGFKGYSQESFPASWEGNYKGELEIYGVDSIAMKIVMKLDIKKKSDSIYKWKISYDLKGKDDVRDYVLKLIDAKKGHYVIDEKNTIEIDSYFKTNILTSFFKVMNSYIVATYAKKEDSIIFEIISADGKNINSTGNTDFKGKTIPKVDSYFVNGRQKAVLIKQ